MFKDREKLYQAYHTLLCMALTWAFVLVINHYFHLNVFILTSALYSFIPALLIYLFDMNKKNAISYFLLLSILPIVALIFWMTKTNPVRWLRELAEWCNTYDGSEGLYKAGFANVVLLGIACLLAITFYLLTRRLLAKIILAVLIFAAMLILSISKIDINKAVVAICIFYILTIIIEVFGIIYGRKAGRQVKKEGILYLAPICLLLALLAIALPSKQEPLQWKAVKSVYNGIKEQIEVWKTELNYYFGRGKSEFFVSLTGYNDKDGELENEGKLIKDNKVALKVSGLDRNKSVYLIGSVNDIYTGSRWEKSRQDFIPDNQEYLLDYVEMFHALARQDLEVLQDNRFVERKALRIVYNNIKTKTFFYPLMMSSYDIFTRNKKLTTQTPQINFVKAKGKGTSYQTIYFEMNLQGEAFTKMLQEADSFSYDAPQDAVEQEAAEYVQNSILAQDNVTKIMDKDYYEALKLRAEMIQEQYTHLPEELPERVYELAQEITAGHDTKYDKLKAIEAYLITNYSYSMDSQKVPEGGDFMDYFLFESKKGYCTSYATAMAVLGRCIGIPTRYVEGFIARFETRDEDYMYLIKNSSAHAWAEAYIEGVGWIPFEATSPFYLNRYTEWPDPVKAGSQVDPGYSSPREFHDDGSQPYQPEEEVVVIEQDNTAEIISGIIIFLSIILILIIVVIVYYYVLKYRYNKNFDKADYSRKMYMLFLRILRQLKREGFTLDRQETVLMLSDRVKDIFHFNRIVFLDIANIFMRYRYAEEAVTKEEFSKVEIFHLGLANKEREEESRLKVWLEEFFFLARKGSYYA
jgi:transglutaminase-like putative cysteine protease